MRGNFLHFRTRCGCVALIVIALGATARAGVTASRPTEYERIEAMIAHGQAEQAVRAIKAVEISLSEFDRLMLTGRACVALHRERQAQDAYEAALRARPESLQARYELGLAYESAGTHALAIACFEKAAFGGLDSADLHAAWARAYAGNGRMLGSLTDVRVNRVVRPGDWLDANRVVVRLMPDDRGLCAAAGRESALFHACCAVRRAAESGEYRLLLADVWEAAGLRREAATEYAAAARLLPERGRGACLEKWAQCLLALRDYDGYFARLREWMALPGGISSARLADAYAKVAQSMRDGGDVARQIRYLTFAVELQPDAAERRLSLSDALKWAGRFGEAADQCREVLRRRPDHPRAAELRRFIKEIQPEAAAP